MPQYGHLPAVWLSSKTKIAWIANWSDPMPHSKAPIPYGKGLSSNISFNTKWYLKKICKNADFHTFPSNRLKNYYLNYLPANPEKCFVLPHIIDKNIYPQIPPHCELRLYHIGGGLSERNPHLFFKALHEVLHMEKFKNFQIDVKFIGPIEAGIEELIKEDNIDNIVKLIGRKPYSEAMGYIEKADMVIVLEAPMEEGIFLPSKIADILGYHKPIFAISPAKGVLADLISTYGCGITTDGKSLSSIKEGLIKVFEQWSEGNLKEHYNISTAYDIFTEKAVWKTLSNIIN